MANPAGTLLAIFERWSRPGEAPVGVRPPTLPESVRDHVMAMHCVSSVQAELDHLDIVGRDTRPWRNALPRWVSAVIAYPVGWSSTSPGDQLYDEATVIDPLRTLADVLEARSLVDDSAATDGVQDLLAAVASLLRDDEQLDPTLRAYIGRLLAECQRALDDFDLFGRFDLDEALRRLWVAVGAAADMTPDETMRTRWRSFRDQALPALAAGMATNVPSWIEYIQRALGQ